MKKKEKLILCLYTIFVILYYTLYMKHYILYTDGACRGNPGPGGRWFILLQAHDVIEKKSGFAPQTTNNVMELSAVLFGIQYICQTNNIQINNNHPSVGGLFSNFSNDIFYETITIDIYLDSQYVRQGVLDYLEDRKKRWRKTSRKKLIKNLTLWQELDKLLWLFSIQRHWVKGHTGDRYNEMADTLACSAIDW